jgi:recombinational DNA repair protein RecT
MSNLVETNARALSQSETVQNKFKDILGDNYKFFMQSVVNSLNMNEKLLDCDGMSV